MADIPAITDRNLEATTNISLKREPACFAFLSARSIAPAMPIDSINLDLASADYFQGRASLWATLEIRSSVSDDRAVASRAAYRMTIVQEPGRTKRCRVVEYVTGGGKSLDELILQPFDNVVLISAAGAEEGDEALFQLPRTDSFLRAFAKMAYLADHTLRDLLDEIERFARKRGPTTSD